MAITTVSSHVVSVNAIQGTLIADNAITAVHIATNAVSGTLIADNAITAVHVAQNSITVTQLADDCVESDKIADGVITTNHLNKAMISSQTEVTPVAGDFVLLGDTSDSNNLKKAPLTLLLNSNVDITSKANLAGSNTTAAAFTSGTGNVVASFTSTDTIGAIQLADNAGNVELSAVGNDFHIQNAGAAAKMVVLNSGNVGIGTTSPSTNLDVYNGSGWGTIHIDGTSGGELAFQKAGTRYGGLYASDSHGLVVEAAAGLNTILFLTSSTERMRIDSSGNVGIGATSPAKPLHLKRTSGWATMRLEGAGDSGGELEFYKGSTKAGGIFFDNSNALNIRCSNTQRMKIHDSGCIDLGANVDRSLGTNITTTVTSGSAGSGFWLSTGNSSATSSKIISSTDGSVGDLLINQGSGVNGGSIRFSVNDSEKMRIPSNGKVGINKIDGTGMLNIQSNSDYTRLIELYGSGTSSGVSSLRIGISGNNSQIAMIGGVSAGYAGLSYHYYYLIPQIQQSDNNGDLRLGGASNRFHTVYSVNGVSTSDERVKEEIENLDVGLDFIKSLKPKKFKYKDKDSDGNYKDGKLEQKNGVKKWGLVAQDVKKALEDNSITEDIGLWSFEKGECNGEVIENQQQLQYQELISPLIKAIQELEARIATLEG